MVAHLAITGRDRGRAEDAARELRAAGGQVDVFVADLSSQPQVRRLAGEVLQSLPGSMCWSTTTEGSRTPGMSPLTGWSAPSP